MQDKIPSLSSAPDTEVAVGFSPHSLQKQRPAAIAGRFNDPLPLARRRFGTVVRELPSMKRGRRDSNPRSSP